MKVKVVHMLWVKGVGSLGTLAIKIKQISKVQI